MIFPTISTPPNVKPGNFRKAFILLFALAVFLLAINILLSFFTPKECTADKFEISPKEINALFLKSVSEFSLTDTYLQKLKPKKKKPDSTSTSYRLTLPFDIPTPVFLQSIYDNFAGKDVAILAIETALNKNSLLEISSGGVIKLRLEIIQDTSLHRNNGEIAFALTDYESLDEDEVNDLLTSPETFAFLLQPKKESVEFTKRILEARKEYIVELTASSPNSEFTLSEDFPFVRNLLAISSIIKSYPRNNFFFVHPQATLLTAKLYEQTRKEFTKRKYTLYSSTEFLNLSELKGDELAARFNQAIEKLKAGEIKVFLIPANYYYASKELLTAITKRGITIIPATLGVVKIKES